MADKVSIEQKIQQYRQANPQLKDLSDKQILSVMVENGHITLTEEQKNSIYSNTQNNIDNTGLTIQKQTKSQIINLKSGRKIVIQDGTTKYYAADGVELKKDYFEKQEGQIDVKPSGRYSIIKAGKTNYYAADGTELNEKYFKQVESADVKIKGYDGKTYNLNNTIANRIHNVGVHLKKAENSNGFIGSTWNGFKNLTGIGDSSDKVREQQETEKKLLQQFNTNEQKRPEIFKQLTGTDYTPDNLEKFIKGEIKLKSEIALQSYTEGQDMATDVGADIISGIAAVGIYTAAVAAAPFSGGASIAVGIAAAGASAAAIKTGLKATDAVTGGREYTLKDIGHDAATGAFSGILAPVTGGLGGAVGKTVATKLGIQAVKQVGKEVAEEAAVSGIKQTVKTVLTNPTGYEYIGGNIVKRGAAFSAEAATDGAVSGAIDNAFRTAYDGGSLEDIGNAAVEGFVGGAIMSPIIGGGMKGVGKGAQAIFGKNNVQIDASGNRINANNDETVVRISPNNNKEMSIIDRLAVANSREDFVVIRDEIKAMPHSSEKQTLQQEYLKKYNEVSRKFNEEFNIRMEYKPAKTAVKRVSDEQYSKLLEKIDGNQNKIANLNKLVDAGFEKETCEILLRYLDLPERIVDDYIQITKNENNRSQIFALFNNLFENKELKPNFELIHKQTLDLLAMENNGRKLPLKEITEIIKNTNGDNDKIKVYLKYTNIQEMGDAQLTAKDIALFIDKIYPESNPEIIEKINQILHLTPEQISNNSGKAVDGNFINSILNKNLSPEQITIIKDLAYNKNFADVKNKNIAIEACERLNFKKDLIELFDILYSSDIQPKSKYMQLKLDPIECTMVIYQFPQKEYIETFRLLAENCKDYKKARNFTSFSQKEIAMLVEYVNIVKNNKNLLENFDKQIFNDKYYSSILDFVTKNQEATIDDITKIMDNIDDAIRKEGAIKNTRLIKNEKLKELAVNLELLGKADSQAIEDISYKLNSVDDEVLTKKINEILNSCIKKAKEGDLDYHYDRSLYEIDMYLDAYHTLTGNYETTLVPGKFFTWNYVKTEKRNFYDYATSDKFYTGDKYDGNFVVTDKEKRFNEIDFPDFIRKDFDDEARVERLKDFLTSHPEDKTLNYLYKEYYLKSLPKEIDDFCNEITEKYGVHLFLSNDYELNPHALPYIKEEFEIWQKASTGKAKYPIIIDFSTIRKRYIDSNAAYNQGASAGFSDGDIVGLAGLQNTIYAIRHELTHHNESNNHNLGKYNIEEIMPHKINEEGVDIPDFENCSYREEFLRAGIAPSHIPYAYNNTAEFIAVAAEGDMSKYSPEFKQMLIDFGMPEWMLSMKQINPTVLKNSADMDFIINEAKKYPIYGENGEELDVTKRYDILSYFKEMYDECQHKAFLTSEELKRHNIPNEPKKLFEYILPRHEEKNIILGDMDLICKIMKGELDEVSPKVEIPAELVAVEESLITTLNRIVKAKRPKAVNHLENISEILKNPEDKLTLLSYLNENPNWLYLVDDLNFTPQNIRLLRELKSLLNEDNISFPALLSFLNNEKISNNLNTEKFMAFIKPLYEKGINLEFMSGTGSKQALEVVAEMFSRKSDDLPKVEYLLKLWESNQKDYPFYYTSLILNTVEDWDVVINRNLIEYKDANGRKLSYGDIFAYSKLTDNEWNNVLKRNLLSLKEDYGEHLTKGANDTFTEGNNDATYLAKLTDNEWNFVVNNRLLEKYNGFQVLELVHNTQNINGVEKSLLEIAMEKGIISIEDSKFPAEINPQDIEIMCNIENWSTLVRNNIFDSLTTRDYLLSINGSLGLKLEKLSTLTDDISWQRIKNHDLLKYENAEDIITLAQLDEDKFTRFIRLKDTEFSQYNKGIGELASLEPEIFAKVQKDLLGKVDSAEAICKLLKLEPEKYNYIVKNGLLSGKILHETTVDLIVNLRKFIGKKNLDELSKADKRELLWLLMENKQNFESSKFNFSEHDGALPLLKGEYKDIIDTVISDLGIYADDFSPEVKLEYSNLLNKLSKPQNNIDNLIDDITSLIPEFKYLGNLRDEITKTIKQLQQKADFHKLSDSDKKVLLTATLLEKCSTSSLDDSAFDASIIVRRLGFSKSEIKKVSNIIKNANLIADFMKLNKETLSVTTPVGVVLESDARQLQLDRIAFSLKESNTFEIAKMLYSTKETEGLGRHLDKLIKNRIQEIKALDFVLPQFTIRSWIEEMSKDPKWLEQHIIGGRLIIYKNELPSEYLGFVHCTDNTAATGGNTGTNIANFDLFAIPNDKVICASYISKENWGTFGGNGLLLSTGNSNQLVGAGYDIWSFGKDTDGILMEYYRDRGLVSHNGKSLKFKHRTSISDSLKEILFGVNYSELCEARRIQVLELENSFRPKILELNDNRIALIHRLARENNLDPNSITNKQYQELRKKYPEIIKIEQQIKDLETQLSTRIDNIKENSMIKEIDSKYIKRVDKLKEFDHPVSLAEIKSIDEELYNAYVEYFSRVPNGRIDDTSLLRSSYHNEVLLNEVDVDAYMVTIGGGRTSIYDAGAIPEEFLKLSKENNIPLIITN